MKKSYTLKAFTLAEVLITLGIIGVVASLTIPSLMNNNQKTQYVVALKKAYSETNQALKQMTTDSGCSDDLKCTGVFGAGTNNETVGTELIKYFKTAKVCGTAAGKGCWSTKVNNSYDGSEEFSNNPDNYDLYKFLTVDGISFAINTYATYGDAYVNCSYNNSSNVTRDLTQTCGYITIDVNGPKGPNCYGRDVFEFYISNGKGAKLYPNGGIDTGGGGYYKPANDCSPSDKSGIRCAARIMEESWQMNY